MGTKGYRKGDYLVQTDGLGKIAFRSDCALQYDGKMKLKKNLDARHPQEFLFARKDEQAVPNPRPFGADVESFPTDPTIL
jgi:hypothetical protein